MGNVQPLSMPQSLGDARGVGGFQTTSPIRELPLHLVGSRPGSLLGPVRGGIADSAPQEGPHPHHVRCALGPAATPLATSAGPLIAREQGEEFALPCGHP
jgi:hypothetical protein